MYSREIFEMKKGIVVAIPVLEPDDKLIGYISELLREGIQKIIVVDDGSGPKYKKIFDDIDRMPKCEVLVHEINQGKGRALKDAITHYLNSEYSEQYDGIITVDADGQHAVKDVLRVADRLQNKPDALVLGEREFDKDVPLRSKMGNNITRHIFHLLYGIKLRDTQTGLRGIPNALLEAFKDIDGERYDYEMNMLIICSRRDISIESVVIQTIYIEDNASSHFNPVKDSAKIYKLLLGNFVKYTLSSLSASIIDIVLFKIMVLVFKSRIEAYILVATVVARIISSLYNFVVNKTVVFNSQKSIFITAVKYYGLCICQMLVSAGLVTLAYSAFPIGETIEKIIIDVLLFFVSYRIQKRFIFE